MRLMRSPLLICWVASAAFSTVAAAQDRRSEPAFQAFGQPASSEDADAVALLIDAFKKAWSAEDAAALANLHSDDVEWINAYARLIRGSKSLERFTGGRLFPAFPASTSRAEIDNMRLISVRYLGASAAVVHLLTDSPRGAEDQGIEGLRRVHLHFVLSRQQDGWRIAHAVIMDARS